jgi:hypothetical protein
VDCSKLIRADAEDIHSCYFEQSGSIALMQHLLRGTDRTVVRSLIPGIEQRARDAEHAPPPATAAAATPATRRVPAARRGTTRRAKSGRR